MSDDQVGPVGEQEFLKNIRAGKIKPDTKVASATRTKGKWCDLNQVPGLLQTWERGVAERERAKQHQAEERRLKQQAAAHERDVARQEQQAIRDAAHQQQQAVANQERAESAEVSDSTNVAAVATIREGISGILTSGEVIEYIAIQQKPVLNVKADAVVATNRLLIFYRPKLLGRFDFSDYLWPDLGNAHLSQGMLRATFSAQHIGGKVVIIQTSYRKRRRLVGLGNPAE